MAKQRKKFRVHQGHRQPDVLVRVKGRCVDAKGAGKLRKRYLIPVMFMECEFKDLKYGPLDEQENATFRVHLEECIFCAAKVFNMKSVVRAARLDPETLEKKRAVRAKLKVISRGG